MRLIDADYFEVIGVKVPTVDPDTLTPVDATSYQLGVVDILSLVDEAPTVDAVAVVRCRDCVYAFLDRWHKSKQDRPSVWRCRKFGRLTVPDGYCHRGKTKEDEENETD